MKGGEMCRDKEKTRKERVGRHMRLCREQERHETRTHAQRGTCEEDMQKERGRCELDVGEASDKPHRDVVIERRSLRNGIVP
jgi:hypothetical protein